MPNSIVHEYQSQLWIMEPVALRSFIQRLAGLPVDASVQNNEIIAGPPELNVVNGIARIEIKGVLLDKVPRWLRYWGIEATGYDEIVSLVNEASNRKEVKEIMLVVDSPGGLVSGVAEASNAIFNVRENKPVSALIQNLSASGAYWLTSQAVKITAADPNTLTGSIGVYTYYVDWTKYEEDHGIKVIVIRSGEHKGMGLDSITENQIAAVQEFINATAGNFIDAVASGRRIEKEKIAEFSTGQLWIAETARQLGLIDTVLDNRNKNQQKSNKGATKMDENQIEKQKLEEEKVKIEQEKKAAELEKVKLEERSRMKALREEFSDDAEYALKAFEEGWTVETAKAEYCDVLRVKLTEKEKEKSQKQSEQSRQSQGASPLAGGDTDGSAEGDFLSEARKMAAEEKISITAAMQKLRRSKPELHQAYLQKCETAGRQMYSQPG